MTFGDSRQSISEFYKSHPDIRCDVIVIDGGHLDDVPAADIKNFRQFVDVNKQHTVLIDDFPSHYAWSVWGGNRFSRNPNTLKFQALE